MVDSGSLNSAASRFEQVAQIAGLMQLGRLPLFLVLATLLARSPKEG
jgi:hypothetical protein